MYGKTIELFLANGTAESLIIAELSNWSGKAIKLPRTEVQSCTREEIKDAGVYFLFCKEEDGTDSVYIGEAENIQERLMIHIRDYRLGKEEYYWNNVVFFVGNLNKTAIRYLEKRLVETARECKRYKVLTKNTYKNTVIKESQKEAMEEFIVNIKILIAALGYRLLEEVPHPLVETIYFYCQGNDSSAKGFISLGGFTVLKGSKISDHQAPSFERHGYYNLRQKLEADGTIVDRIFQYDYEFTAPSAASSVILGHSTNGNIEWKTENGKKLKDTEV